MIIMDFWTQFENVLARKNYSFKQIKGLNGDNNIKSLIKGLGFSEILEIAVILTEFKKQ
jgi:hypothetical protein